MSEIINDYSEIHISPKYYGYKGGFDKVGKCLNCGVVSLYEDFHPVNPCVQCGATDESRQWFSAKWVSTSKLWKPKTWGLGYWEQA